MTKKEWINHFGDNIKKIIDESGMTKKEIAEKTYLTESAISRYINKKRVPSVKAVVNLSVVLGVSIKELIGFANHVE